MVRTALAQQPLPLIRLLLVEDSPSDAFVVDSLLEEILDTNYETTHFKTQSDAIVALNECAFDVCLLDLTLPDANGFSALIDIQEKAPDMPVLILTGINDTALAKRAVGRGAQDYLLKDDLELAVLGRAIDYAIERKRMEKILFERANYDTLTGLANRSMFESRLSMAMSRAERTGSGIALLFIDLDHFKPINDTHGHDAGDDVLKTIAKRLKKALRAYDTASRFGGDEFAVLLEGILSPRDAAIIAQKLCATMATPIPYDGKNLKVAASIGIVFSDTAIAPDALLKNADIAMYYAKKEGGGTYRFYASEMHRATESYLKLEEDLLIALSKNELRLHYQPYVTPGGEAVLGIETLLRWANPDRGMLMPSEFFAAAEAGHLMPKIAEWMGLQLRNDIAMWNAHNLPPLEIAINISASQLDAPGLIDWLAPLAQEDFLGDHRLVAEISEDALSSFNEARFLTLAKLGNMGIGLHLDHFGRGALSLKTLNALPFSLLKIDMSLIQRMSSEASSDALISTAILLAHHMGMKAGAVGVETPWQMQELTAQKCDVMQGFLTAHPMTAQQLVEWMAKPQSSGPKTN